jgi:N-acetylglucosaminyl-diphospho-decaprenol L-rhamnosyltransferase
MHSLSYIVVTYNSSHTIEECLNALTQQTACKPRCEIIVLDNASEDDTVRIVASKFPAVMLRHTERNSGFAAAANSAGRHAGGEYLCFINPDAVVAPDFGKELDLILSLHDRIDIAGGIYGSPDGTPAPSSWRLPDLLTIAAESFLSYAAANRLTASAPAGIGDVCMVSGGCLIIRKALFDELRGFDERFFLYYEDADLCRRAHLSGYGCVRYPSLRAVHYGRKSFGEDRTSFFYHYYRSKLLYCVKHFSPAKCRMAKSMIVAGIRIRCTAYRIVHMMTGRTEFYRLSVQHRDALKKIIAGTMSV